MVRLNLVVKTIIASARFVFLKIKMEEKFGGKVKPYGEKPGLQMFSAEWAPSH